MGKMKALTRILKDNCREKVDLNRGREMREGSKLVELEKGWERKIHKVQ